MVTHIVAARIPVGNYAAFKAPFFAQNAGHKRVIVTGKICADAVERTHYSVGSAFFYGYFKRSEIIFPEILFGSPGIYVAGVIALFADCKVFEIAIKVVVLCRFYYSRRVFSA